jgi:hypothetical protein
MGWISGLAPLLAALVFTACVIAGVWLVVLASRGRLMRCPDTGAIASVEVARTGSVRSCDLWPRDRHCGQGCLARRGELPAGRRIDLEALRPF